MYSSLKYENEVFLANGNILNFKTGCSFKESVVNLSSEKSPHIFQLNERKLVNS